MAEENVTASQAILAETSNATTSSVEVEANISLSASPSRSPQLSAVLLAEMWLWRLWPPVLLVLGTFGNWATIATLRRLRSGWSSISVYLTALALSDTFMLYSGLVGLWLRLSFGVNIYISHVLACKLFPWLNNTMASVSAWLVVCLTMQRVASVLWPHRVAVICTRRRSGVVIVAVCVTLGLLYSHLLYGYGLFVKGGATLVCEFISASYSRFWGGVWARVDLFIFSVIPATVIVIGNVLLVWKLVAAKRRAKQELLACQGLQNDDRARKTSSATITVIVVSLTFLCLSLPLMVYVNVFYASIRFRSASELHHLIYNMLFLSSLSNFSVNFYLYCLTGSRFRKAFLDMVLCRPEEPARPRG